MIERVKIVRYSNLQISKLEAEINDLISQGWQPLGEIKITKVDNIEILIQQMILEKE